MEFKIKLLENTKDGLFAEVISEDGQSICMGEGDNPYSALEDACMEFAEILRDCSERENDRILKMIEERTYNDDGIRYSLDEVKNMIKDR